MNLSKGQISLKSSMKVALAFSFILIFIMGLLNINDLNEINKIKQHLAEYNNNAISKITGFASYISVDQAGDNISLYIYDSVENSTAQVGETVWFYANYTNNSVHISSADCNISFSNGNWSLMAESGNQYNHSRNFSSAGIYEYNVTYDGLNVGDDLEIEPHVRLHLPYDNYNTFHKNLDFVCGVDIEEIIKNLSLLINATGEWEVNQTIDLAYGNNKISYNVLNVTNATASGTYSGGQNDNVNNSAYYYMYSFTPDNNYIKFEDTPKTDYISGKYFPLFTLIEKNFNIIILGSKKTGRKAMRSMPPVY